MKKNRSPSNFFIYYSLIVLMLLCSLQTANANTDSNKKNIVVTIKPLEGLVRAIAKDSVNIQRLLPDYVSLHHYHFRPSDLRKIKTADILFRIDEEMERFLSPVLKTHYHPHVVSLADDPNIKLLATRTKNTHEEQTPDNAHHHGAQDLHIWMSPYNGIVMADKITTELSRLNPHYQAFYQQNAEILKKKINHFTQRFQQQIRPLQHKPYLVFHDSWHYFANTFQLEKIATINLHPDLQLGVRTLMRTRRQIGQGQAQCLFIEPSFRPKTIQTLVEGFSIKTMELDTLGSHLKDGDDLYLDLLRYTAQQIKNCLKG
jgi:zinc transport system substrate-binding protein